MYEQYEIWCFAANDLSNLLWPRRVQIQVLRSFVSILLLENFSSNCINTTKVRIWDHLDPIFHYKCFHQIVQTIWNFVFRYGRFKHLFRPWGVQITCFLDRLFLIFYYKTFYQIVRTIRNLVFRNKIFKQSSLAKESPDNKFWDHLYRFFYS